MLWIFFPIAIFIMHQKNAFGQKNSNFMHGFKNAILAIFQRTKRGFSKKALTGIYLFLVLGSCESIEGLEH